MSVTFSRHVPPGPRSARAPASARLPRLLGVESVDRALARAVITVVGAGSVGLGICLSLARLGIGGLRIVDRARCKPESLLTHPIGPEHVGKSKAEVAAELCAAIHPACAIELCDGAVADLPPAALAADAVCLATDNAAAELEVGERCLRTRTPLMQASLHGETLVAQVRAFGNQKPASDPCPACAFSAFEWQQVREETSVSCDGTATPRVPNPTRSLASLCSLAGDLLCLELVRRLLGDPNALENQMLDYHGFRRRLVLTRLAKHAACPADHRDWRTLAVDAPLASWRPAELLALAGVEAHASLAATGYRFVQGRFVAAPSASVSFAELGDAATRSLGELGLAEAGAVVLAQGESAWLVCEGAAR